MMVDNDGWAKGGQEGLQGGLGADVACVVAYAVEEIAGG